MTDAQMIAIALIASVGAVVYNNARVTDLRDSVNKRLITLTATSTTSTNSSIKSLTASSKCWPATVKDFTRLEHPSERD